MAAKIELGLATYLVDFDGGQVGFRTNPYLLYSTDLDTNFVTLRATINTLVEEVAAVNGPNAGLGVDILVFNDPERVSSGEPNDAAGANRTGFVGLESYEPAITTTSTANDSVTIDPGVFIVDGLAVRTPGTTVKVGSGLSGNRFLAIDINGVVFLELTANQRAADLWLVNWNGTAFTGAFTRQNQMFFDGDEYEAMRARPATGSSPITFPALRFEAFRFRLLALERMLAGFATDTLGNALGQPAWRAGTAGAPSQVFEGDPNTGFFSSGPDTINASTAGVSRFALSTTAFTMTIAILAILGTAGAPGYAFSGDADTGLFSPGANRAALATAGNQALEVDATGNIDLALNSRVKGVRTAVQSIADNTATLISFTAAEEFDVGTWHNAGGGAPGDQEFTVPTGADGLYHIQLNTEWASPAVVTDFLLEITVNGTALQEKTENRLLASGSYSEGLGVMRVLAAGDVVRARVTQIDTVGAAALDLQTASLSIVKVA